MQNMSNARHLAVFLCIKTLLAADKQQKIHIEYGSVFTDLFEQAVSAENRLSFRFAVQRARLRAHASSTRPTNLHLPMATFLGPIANRRCQTSGLLRLRFIGSLAVLIKFHTGL
jgi:hypothetical protein